MKIRKFKKNIGSARLLASQSGPQPIAKVYESTSRGMLCRRTKEMWRQLLGTRRLMQDVTRRSTILEYISRCHDIWSSPPTFEETFFTDGSKTERNGNVELKLRDGSLVLRGNRLICLI
ncbi:hypothetical protein E4U33_000509, partial [Claviceps sp. LM78 group G4]